jgi:hypothetical protein
MTPAKAPSESLSWKQSFLNAALAVVCFNAAYFSTRLSATGFLIFGYAFFSPN